MSRPLSTLGYRLVVLTHGDSEPLPQTLASFAENVSPAPASAYLHQDGGGTDLEYLVATLPCAWTIEGSFAQRGFCRATAAAWRAATQSDHDYVFWLEHDFRFLRPLDLAELAVVLDAYRYAQMQLMRGAVSDEEIAAGGLFESRPGQYRPMGAYVGAQRRAEPLSWLEHAAYLTTNPCLMRRDFMIENQWPDYPADCEGRFGLDLVARGFRFGVWGRGQPWVEHVGVRNGSGY